MANTKTKTKSTAKTDALAAARKATAGKSGNAGTLFKPSQVDDPAEVAELDNEIAEAQAKFGKKKPAVAAAVVELEDDGDEEGEIAEEDEAEEGEAAATDEAPVSGEAPAAGEPARPSRGGGVRGALVKTLTRTNVRVRRFLSRLSPEAQDAVAPLVREQEAVLAWLADPANAVGAKRATGSGRKPSSEIPVGAHVRLTKKATALYSLDDPQMVGVVFHVVEKGAKLATIREPLANVTYSRIPLAHLKNA